MATRPRRGTTKTVGGGVNAALKARWAETLDVVRRSKAGEAAQWDELYEKVGEILDSEPPLYLAGGYASARAFLRAELPDLDERTVRSYVRVARHFEPEHETRYGISRLALLLDHLEALNGGELPAAKIDPARQKVRIAFGKTTKLVPFADLSADDLRAATRRVKSRGSQPATASPLVRALRSALGRAGLGAVSVSVSRAGVRLGVVEPGKLQALGRALAKLRLSTR